jgi:plasmid stabilization system protein ParE
MVIWSEPAKADFRSIHNFIALDSKYYAKKVTQDIREKADILNELPNMGKKVAEVGEDNIKELSLYSYRIIYEIKTEDLIEVLAVIHKRQNFTADDLP